MLLDSVQYNSYYQCDSLAQYTLSPSSSPSYYSPQPSPFSNTTDNFFSYPSAFQESVKDDWRAGGYDSVSSQPPSPTSVYGGYHSMYPVESPLLSQSASTPDGLRYTSSSTDIPETVRFSGHSSLNTDHGLSSLYNTVDQSFGHNMMYSANQNTPMYQSNNLQVQQWSEDLCAITDEKNAKVTNISEDSNDHKELFDEDEGIDEDDDESSGMTSSMARCKWADCNMEFNDMEFLVAHINNCHIQARRGSEEYPCFWKNCSRQHKPFNAKYKLVTHLRVHTGERPFKCKQPGCGRSFARLENLKIHNRSHTGEKPFLCKYFKECQKAFSNSSDRAKHEQTHKDPKPYRCEVVGCSKRYTDPSSLRKHVKNHSKEDQEQVRIMKENMKERRGSHPDILSHTWQHNQRLDTTHDLMTSSNNLLMSGGGLVTTVASCDQASMEADLQWTRRLEAEEARYHGYYGSHLYVDVS